MRELRMFKFRAWVNREDLFAEQKKKHPKGKMFTGFTFSNIYSGRDEANVFLDNDDVWEEPVWEKATLMQWTGLKDKNGKDIYENDVVKFNDKVGIIKFEASMFIIGCDELPDSYIILSEFVNSELWCEDVEVIGNVFENNTKYKKI